MALSPLYLTCMVLISTPLCAMELEHQRVWLIPSGNNIVYDNLPLIPLEAALQSTTFKNSYNDFTDTTSAEKTSKEKKIVEFFTYSDVTTTEHFAHCLKKAYKINRLKNKINTLQNKRAENNINLIDKTTAEKNLNKYLKELTSTDLAHLVNLTNYADCSPSPTTLKKTESSSLPEKLLLLPKKLQEIVTQRTLTEKNTDAVKKLDSDVQKTIISQLTTQRSIESNLLQAYADSLINIETLNPELWLGEKSQNDITFLHYFNTNTGTIITSNYITTHDNVDEVDEIKIIKKNQHEVIINCSGHHLLTWKNGINITSNADESLFIIELPNFFQSEPKTRLLIDYNNQSLMVDYVHYCFTHPQAPTCTSVYCVDANNTIWIKNLSTHSSLNFPSPLSDDTQDIYEITVNPCGNVMAISTSDKIFIGARSNENNPFVFTPVDPPALNNTPWHAWHHTITLNNEGDLLFIVNKQANHITIYNRCTKKSKSLSLPLIEKNCLCFTPLLIQKGEILFIQTLKDYIFLDTKTHQGWSKNRVNFTVGHAHNHEKIIQQKVERLDHSHTNGKKITNIVTIIDDNIKKTVDTFYKDTPPLIYCTIALNPPGTITLSDNDYSAYLTLPQQERAVIDASYTITNTQTLSRIQACAKAVYKKITPRFFIMSALTASLIAYLTLHDNCRGFFRETSLCLPDISTMFNLLKQCVHQKN